jgi:hypothetical protein
MSLKEVYIKLASNKYVWLFLLVFVIIPLVSLSHQTVLGSAAFQPIAFEQAGSELFFEVRNVLGVKDVNIQITGDIKNGLIEFKEDENIIFMGKPLNKFRMSSANDESIGKIDMTFKIHDKQVAEKGLTQEDVSLFVNGNKVDLTKTRKGRGFIYYTASTEEMGEFVLGKEYPVAAAAEVSAPEESTEDVEEAPEPEASPVEPSPEGTPEPRGTLMPKWMEKYATAILLGAVGLVMLIIVFVVHGFSRKHKPVMPFDKKSMEKWIRAEQKAGTHPKDITKILMHHTGKKRKEILDAFPNLAKKKTKK